MIDLGLFEWLMVIINVICWIGFVWSLRYAKKINYPHIRKEGSIVGTIITVFTVSLLLYLFGVIK